MLFIVIVSLYPAGNALLLTPVNVIIWFEAALHANELLIFDGLFRAVTKNVQAPLEIDNSGGSLIITRLLGPKIFDVVMMKV
jgi:hypothetical protein